MKSTKRNAKSQHVSAEDALQMLQSAIGYCQMAGLVVQGVNTRTGLELVIPGVCYTVEAANRRMKLRIGVPTESNGVAAQSPTGTAIIYARGATSQEEKVQEQIDKCQTWARERGYRVQSVYFDGGSGNDPKLPQRAEAMAHAAAENAVLVCLEPSRLARDPAFLAQILATCKRRGVTVCFVEA